MALTDGLISWYQLNEASGSRADSVGANTLTDNGVTPNTTGIIGNAALFSRASSQSLDAPNSSVFPGNQNFTISCWANFTQAVPTSGNPYYILTGKYQSGGLLQEYALSYNVIPYKFELYVTNGNSTVFGIVGKIFPVIVGARYHIVFWHDKKNQNIGIQVNGQSSVVEQYYNVSTKNLILDQNSGALLRVGGRQFAGGTGYMDGFMDLYGYWNRVLEEDERQRLYANGNGTTYPSF